MRAALILLLLLLEACHARATTNTFDPASPLDRSDLAHREPPTAPANDGDP